MPPTSPPAPPHPPPPPAAPHPPPRPLDFASLGGAILGDFEREETPHTATAKAARSAALKLTMGPAIGIAFALALTLVLRKCCKGRLAALSAKHKELTERVLVRGLSVVDMHRHPQLAATTPKPRAAKLPSKWTKGVRAAPNGTVASRVSSILGRTQRSSRESPRARPARYGKMESLQPADETEPGHVTATANGMSHKQASALPQAVAPGVVAADGGLAVLNARLAQLTGRANPTVQIPVGGDQSQGGRAAANKVEAQSDDESTVVDCDAGREDMEVVV